jgi:hypothetical protein
MKATTDVVQTAPASHDFVVREWRPYQKNTLRGFLSLELPSGLILHGLTLHDKEGRRWVGMPAKSFEKDGTTTWAPQVEFSSKESRERFQVAAIEAIDAYFDGKGKA